MVHNRCVSLVLTFRYLFDKVCIVWELVGFSVKSLRKDLRALSTPLVSSSALKWSIIKAFRTQQFGFEWGKTFGFPLTSEVESKSKIQTYYNVIFPNYSLNVKTNLTAENHSPLNEINSEGNPVLIRRFHTNS